MRVWVLMGSWVVMGVGGCGYGYRVWVLGISACVCGNYSNCVGKVCSNSTLHAELHVCFGGCCHALS